MCVCVCYLVVDVDPVGIFAGTELQVIICIQNFTHYDAQNQIKQDEVYTVIKHAVGKCLLSTDDIPTMRRKPYCGVIYHDGDRYCHISLLYHNISAL